MRKSWQQRATKAYKQITIMGLWNPELSDRNYSGAGGTLNPDGTLVEYLTEDDVAWEQLYFDCMYTIRENL